MQANNRPELEKMMVLIDKDGEMAVIEEEIDKIRQEIDTKTKKMRKLIKEGGNYEEVKEINGKIEELEEKLSFLYGKSFERRAELQKSMDPETLLKNALKRLNHRKHSIREPKREKNAEELFKEFFGFEVEKVLCCPNKESYKNSQVRS